MTLRSFVIRGLAFAAATLLLVTGMAAPSLAVDDVLVPSSLVSFHRTSPDVVRHGDDITIDWEVQDSPAKNVIFYLRDRLGSDLQVRWDAPNGTSAYSGTARFTVDETSLAPGDLTLWGFGAGNGYASVSYRTDGTIYKSPSGIQSPKPATFDYAQITTLFEAETDISVPPSLVSFHRTSADVVRHGDDITIDWEVQDSPAKNVIFYLRDRLGSDLQVRWDAPNGTSAYSGTARFTVDETSLAPGDLTLWGFGAGNGYASVSYRTDGTIYKSPSGIQSPKPATFDYAQITTLFEAETDISVPPSLVSFHRTSADVVRNGDDITIDWEVQDSPAKNVIFYLRDRLGSDLQVRWDAPNGTSAYSGTARFTVDETSLATGDLTLWGFGAGNGYASVSYRTDGTIYKSPSGIQSPKPATFDYAQITNHVSPLTPYATTPAAVVFRDNDGTENDAYTVPATEGVEYLIGDEVVLAGTHPGIGELSVTARPKIDYVFTDGAATQWSGTFKATPYDVMPAAVVFTDKDGTAEDTYTVPAMEGVEYLVGEKVVEAGTYPGAGEVTVTARAKTDYVVKAGATTEWKFAFKATPYAVIPAAVVFEDKDGMAEDAYTVPATDGVEYLVGEKVVEAGTYRGAGEVTVTARAKTDYVVKAGATTEWKFAFKATPYAVIPAAVVFEDKDGMAEDTYTVPATDGVEYLVGEKVVEAGTYRGAGEVTVTARAKTDYVVKAGATTEWKFAFKATPYAVIPAAVVFEDKDGMAEDAYTVPATDGVEYLVGEKVVEAGTYRGAGEVTVTARAKTDYVLKSGAVTAWTVIFKATPFEVAPAAVMFADKDGTAGDSYTVPATDGVEYLVTGQVVDAGTYPGSGVVTVTARAKTDYVVKASAVAEWMFTFKSTPHEVVPLAVVFTDKDGTAEDTFTVPATDGVEYLIEDKVLEAGTYPGSGDMTVTARAKTDYVVAAGVAIQWNFRFKAIPFAVTAAPVVFSDADGTAEDRYTIPSTPGVDYSLGGKVIAAGTYPGNGTVTVAAEAKPDYLLKAGSASSWSFTFRAAYHFTLVVGTGDLNGDRRADVLARDSSGALWLYPGNGRGGWLVRVKAGTGWNGFTAVGPGDMNGDGKADVLARDASGVLWLYPGNGRGGWLVRVKAGTGWNGFTAVVGPGDMNGDGKADVLARDTSGALWLYPGNGRGGWLARVKAGTGWNGFTAVVGPGDMNGDRKADVLARDSGGTLWLYRGNGRGGFTLRTGAGSGWNTMASIVGTRDFNGDGRNDVLAIEKTGTLLLFRGNGAGGWLGRSQAGTGWN